ncbi:hypothetical protein ACHAWO_007271 [Cyclotella atomus]|uniref:Pyridoxamine 5'-phosphate oxidase Alr4036 family FMN-binding domain-containing protein n=1 Tax=Cyclotella atomus TaxID=382360 RepID=A0ABD3MTT9_9STRA
MNSIQLCCMLFSLSICSSICRHVVVSARKPSFAYTSQTHRSSSGPALVSRRIPDISTTFRAPEVSQHRGQTVCRMSTESTESVGLTDGGKSNSNTKMKDDTIIDWKSRIDISIAKSRKIRGSNYVQISTVDHATMEPRCRTVVFRGFMKDVPLQNPGAYGDCVMKMITDLRSNKVMELESFHSSGNLDRSNVEMVWWFPKSSEQYRIRGKLQFIGNDGPLYSYNESDDNICNNKEYFIAERKQQWGNLSDMAREQFYWEDPGISYTSTCAKGEGIPAGGRDDDGKVLPPPDTFLLMLLNPTTIDYLRLGDNFRQVDKWEDGQWLSTRVNP